MTLPIDPTAIDPEDIGEEQVVLAMGHDEAIDFVRQACEDAEFGVPVEFSPSDILNEKLGTDRDPYYVLGACNPAMAERALDASDNRLGALMPCNVVIWEEEPGRQRVYHVSIMRIGRLVGIAPDDGTWEDIVAATGAYVDDLFSSLRASEYAVE